ncbi:helix-turn-helix domain-containing protein [Clostridium botulinum]|uniref:Helix-turn-helix domain-containing protein n=1 Tax=Clostridium botulinum TaxID=1491 RepID=A0A6M0SN59_CLOBO|nr:helix-turn-helix domain-containing protein [Clostridium botulinum]
MSEIVKDLKEKLILSPAEARARLGFSKNSMYNILAEDKTFPAWREGDKWCINANKLQEWIDNKSNKKR